MWESMMMVKPSLCLNFEIMTKRLNFYADSSISG